MIEHLRGWEKPWNLSAGPDGRRNGLRLSVSIAASLSGLNSVITSMRPRITASRFVKALVERRSAVESEWPLVNDGGRTCRISGGEGDLSDARSREHPPVEESRNAGCQVAAALA